MNKAATMLNKDASLINLGKGLINATKATHGLKALGSSSASYRKSLGSAWNNYAKKSPNMAKGLKTGGISVGAVTADRIFNR